MVVTAWGSGTGLLHPRVVELFARPSIAQRTPDWYAARLDMLTASDVAAALDIKPYASYGGSARAHTLKRKLDNLPCRGPALDHGVKHEDEARDLAALMLDEVVYEFGLLVHPREPWLAASPDGVTHSGKLMEIKCPLKREIVPGEVPHHYMPQLQVQMEVCDLDSTIFVQYKPAALTRGGAFLDVVLVERDRQWFARHRDAMHEFWREYMAARPAHVPPAPPPCLVDPDMYADRF